MKRAQKKINRIIESESISASLDVGLTSAQVERRIEDGLFNKAPKRVTKTYGRILYDDVFNFFNILLFSIFLLMCIASYWQGMFFVVVMLLNTSIGLAEDIHARNLANKLQLVVEPKARVLRDGKESEIPVGEIVLSDVVLLKRGEQISADGTIAFGSVEVNEALLTGESESITKESGAEVFSGTYVTSGNAKMIVTKVGKANFAEALQERAKHFKRPKSQILKALKYVFRVIGTIVIVLGLATFITYAVEGRLTPGGTLNVESVKAISGSMVAMIPSGMYLLTSITMAVGVIKLARKRMLVQELYCIEMLARTDTLCLDKTGTLTDGTFQIDKVVPFKDTRKEELMSLLLTLVTATGDDNGTARAILESFQGSELLPYHSAIPFSSEGKYSAVMLKDGRSIVLGAAEFAGADMKKIGAAIEKYTSEGLRALVVTQGKRAIRRGEKLSSLKPLGLLILRDRIRKDAAENVAWFQESGVAIKLISGDNVSTVRAIARRVGVKDADKAVSLEGVPIEDVRKMADDYAVFARVSPRQKEALVEGLHDNKHIVTMTGDGVNDILALRNADCSIAMAEGAAAARTISHLVALDSDFSALQSVVAEGRRAVNNLQRTCSLFLVKTFFAIIMTVTFLIANWILPGIIYPFNPNNMYLWEFVMIGFSSFFLALQPNEEKIRSTFLFNVFTMSIPAGIVQVSVTAAYFIMIFFGGMTYEAAATYSVVTFTLFSLFALYRISWPYDKYRLVISIGATIMTPLVFLLDYGVTRNVAEESPILYICYKYLRPSDHRFWVVIPVMLLGIALYFAMDVFFSTVHAQYLSDKERRKA